MVKLVLHFSCLFTQKRLFGSLEMQTLEMASRENSLETVTVLSATPVKTMTQLCRTLLSFRTNVTKTRGSRLFADLQKISAYIMNSTEKSKSSPFIRIYSSALISVLQFNNIPSYSSTVTGRSVAKLHKH